MIWLAICRVWIADGQRQAQSKQSAQKRQRQVRTCAKGRIKHSSQPNHPDHPDHHTISRATPTPPLARHTYFVVNLLAQKDNPLAVQPVVDVHPVRRRGTGHTVRNLGHPNRHHRPPSLGRRGRHDRRRPRAHKSAAAASGRQGCGAHTGDAADKGGHGDGGWEHTQGERERGQGGGRRAKGRKLLLDRWSTFPREGERVLGITCTLQRPSAVERSGKQFTSADASKYLRWWWCASRNEAARNCFCAT